MISGLAKCILQRIPDTKPRVCRQAQAGRLVLLAALAAIVTACVGGGGVAGSWPGVAAAGDTVYVAFGQQVHALNLSDGKERWVFPSKGDSKVTFYADPAIAGDLLVVGAYGSQAVGWETVLEGLGLREPSQAISGGPVYGVNAADGSEKWHFGGATDHIVAGALLGDDMVYAASADYNLYALDAASGEKRWEYASGQAIWATPLLNGGRLYVPSLDHHLYAFNAQTGALLWDRQLGGAVAGTPALSDGLLIVGAFDNKLYAVNTSDGSIKWARPTDGWVWSGPLVEDGTLYFGDLTGMLYAANAETGDVIWKVKPKPASTTRETADSAIRGTPALADGTLYVTSRDGFVYAYAAADGTMNWEKEVGGQLLSSPIIAGDKILVAAYGAKDNQLVFALNVADGSVKWVFSFPPKAQPTPTP